jgi:hypothetical protein
MNDAEFIPLMPLNRGITSAPELYPFETIHGKGFNNDHFSSDSR